MSKTAKISSKTPMTQPAVARIMSATAKQNGGGVPSGSFAAIAQRTVATTPALKK